MYTSYASLSFAIRQLPCGRCTGVIYSSGSHAIATTARFGDRNAAARAVSELLAIIAAQS